MKTISTVQSPALAQSKRGLVAADFAGDFSVWLIGLTATLLLRARHASWRKDVDDLARLDRAQAGGEKVLVAFWHSKYRPLFSLLRGRQACILTSQSFRGRIIGEIARRFGYDCVLLPFDQGRRTRYLMREVLAGYQTVALGIDGPLGPRHVVKRGVLELASDLGFAVLPVSAASRRRRIDARRWDRSEHPRLFTRVALAIEDPIAIPADRDRRKRADLRGELASRLESAGLRAEEMVNRYLS